MLKRTFLAFQPRAPEACVGPMASPMQRAGRCHRHINVLSPLWGRWNAGDDALSLSEPVQNYLHIFAWPAPVSQGRGESSPTATQHPLPSGIPRAGLRQTGNPAQLPQSKGSPITPGANTAQSLTWQHLHVNMVLLFPCTCSYLL